MTTRVHGTAVVQEVDTRDNTLRANACCAMSMMPGLGYITCIPVYSENQRAAAAGTYQRVF